MIYVRGILQKKGMNLTIIAYSNIPTWLLESTFAKVRGVWSHSKVFLEEILLHEYFDTYDLFKKNQIFLGKPEPLRNSLDCYLQGKNLSFTLEPLSEQLIDRLLKDRWTQFATLPKIEKRRLLCITKNRRESAFANRLTSEEAKYNLLMKQAGTA